MYSVMIFAPVNLPNCMLMSNLEYCGADGVVIAHGAIPLPMAKALAIDHQRPI